MSAPCPLYHTLTQHILALLAPHVPARSCIRFALLICGIIATRSAVLTQIAAELAVLDLTGASNASIERRLRRALADRHLTYATCYRPLLAQVLDWDTLLRGDRRVVLAGDDSSHTARIHLLRVSLTYWGGSLPLAWALWPQNVAQAPGHYWTQLDTLLAQVAELLPAGLEVVVTADRACAVPNFIDRVVAQGWHWVVRVTTTGSHRFRDVRGPEHELRTLVGRYVGRAGRRWKARGAVFKDAGWRDASVVGLWGRGAHESLVVLTDLPARWAVLALYERRYWIEPGFRNDKTRGWQWEASQVRGRAAQERLLLALAWASVVVLSVGLAAAREQMAGEQHRRAAGAGGQVRRAAGAWGQVRRAQTSIFTQGLRAVRRWVYGTATTALPWGLGDLAGPSWVQRWHRVQAQALIFPTLGPPGAVRPPPGGAGRDPLWEVLALLARPRPNECSVRS